MALTPNPSPRGRGEKNKPLLSQRDEEQKRLSQREKRNSSKPFSPEGRRVGMRGK